jgi:hypothetical protein
MVTVSMTQLDWQTDPALEPWLTIRYLSRVTRLATDTALTNGGGR